MLDLGSQGPGAHRELEGFRRVYQGTSAACGCVWPTRFPLSPGRRCAILTSSMARSRASSQSSATFQRRRRSSRWTCRAIRSACSSCLPIRTATCRKSICNPDESRPAIQEALGGATARGDLCIDFVEAGTGSTLDRLKVQGRRSHVSRPALFRSRQQRRTRTASVRGRQAPLRRRLRAGRISSRHWSSTLPSLRLVILNACELARPGEGLVRYTPFTNLAACFLNAGAAMVVAMQYPIRTDTATTFTARFMNNSPRILARLLRRLRPQSLRVERPLSVSRTPWNGSRRCSSLECRMI